MYNNNMSNSLSALIQSYSSCGMKMEYEGTRSFHMAASCHYLNNKGEIVKRNHQRRYLTNAVLNMFAELLEKRKQDLDACNDFESLMEVINNIQCRGIGPLTRYDTASAIGYIRNPTILPDQFVYLHAGVAKGYKALVTMGLVPPCKGLRVSIDVFGCLEELKTLDPETHAFPNGASFAMIVEDFLCVKHKQLQELSLI